MLEAEINNVGDVLVEGQHVGQLNGFRFTPDPQAAGEAARTLNAAAQKALASEIESRAARVNEAVDSAFVLANDGLIRWLGEPVARLTGGDHLLLPRVRLMADEQLSGPALELVQKRLDVWVDQHIKKLLGRLALLELAEGVEGIGRGIAYTIAEALGVLERARVGNEMKSLDQAGRAALRKHGVRFGAYHLYLPQLLKPAPRTLAALLWALRHGGVETVKGLSDVAHLASSGRTSFPADKETPKALYQAAGFRVCGERAVRVDILERLADLIRPAINYRPGVSVGDAPTGTADGDGFVVTVGMTSLAGCSGESFASILKSLGYVTESRKGPAITVPLLKAAATQPVKPVTTETETSGLELSADTSEPVDVDSIQNEGKTTSESVVTEPEPATNVAEATPDSDSPPAATEQTQAHDADAPASPAEETLTPPAESEAEPALIEIWRPGRRPQHREGPRPERNRPRNARRDGHAPHQAQAGGTGQTTPALEGGLATKPPEGQEASTGRLPRPDRTRRFEGFKGRGDQSAPRERTSNAADRPGGPRPPRPPFKDRPNRSDKPFATTERPAQRERQPDPNSPFAKLLALKAELESKARKE